MKTAVAFFCFVILLLCGFGEAIVKGGGIFEGISKDNLFKSLANSHRAAVETVQYTGASKECINGKQYVLDYNITVPAGFSFINLDDVNGLFQVGCNVDNTALLLAFVDDDSMNDFLNRLKIVNGFVTGNTQFRCHNKPIIRRVMDFAPLQDSIVVLSAIATKYDEIFQNASINFGPSSDNAKCTPQGHEDVCLGVNTDKQCDNAAGPINIYENEYLTVTCSDCYLALEADIFVTIHMEWWSMTSFSGGFKNISILGALVLDMLAHYSWSAGVDKTMPIIQPTTVVNFWVGPVPIEITFEIPLEQVLSANFDATAEAIVGAKMDWKIGDWYVQWDWEDGWKHSKTSPKLTWTPVLSGSAQFHAGASLALIPSFTVIIDNFFTTTYTLNPTLMLAANGSTTTQKLCSSMSYDIDVFVQAELFINLPWFAIHDDYKYGPKTLWDSGTQNIGQYCVKV